jgi:hypothetical protein
MTLYWVHFKPLLLLTASDFIALVLAVGLQVTVEALGDALVTRSKRSRGFYMHILYTFVFDELHDEIVYNTTKDMPTHQLMIAV